MANFNTVDATTHSCSLATGLPAWLRRHPQDWQAGTLDRAALYARAEALYASPQHLASARQLASQLLSFLDGMAVARRVVRDMPMYMLLSASMYLHHRRDAADPDSGVSLKSLRTLFTHPDRPGTYAGDTHLRDMLAWARLSGLLQRVPAVAGARRVQRFEPTELMQDMFRGWLLAFMRGSAQLLAPPAPLDAPPSAHAAFEVLSYRISGYLRDGFVLTERHPFIQQLMMRRHGYHVFLSLVEGLHEHDGVLTAPVSVSALAQRFDVARGTVRNTLALAQQSGHLRFDSAAGWVTLDPQFAQQTLRWMALEALWMNGLTAAALQSRQHPAADTHQPDRATP